MTNPTIKSEWTADEWNEFASNMVWMDPEETIDILGQMQGTGFPAGERAEKIAADAAEDFIAYTAEGYPVIRTAIGNPDTIEVVVPR